MRIALPKGGQVIGVGTDIIEVERIRRVHQKYGDRFLKRLFTEEERSYCFSMKNPYPHLAARFAAKEAVSKAFTTGIGRYLDWTSISIYNGGRRQPYVRLIEKGQALLKEVGGSKVLISLSHTANHATAVALLLKESK